MMSYTHKNTGKSTAELTITVPVEDYQKNLLAAAGRLSERAAIKGFRPGKAPYNIVKQQLGEIKILEEAMQSIVESSFFKAVSEEKLSTIGMPQISLQKFAPGNELIFTAAVALLPTLQLPALESIKIEPKGVEVGEAELQEVLGNLSKMQGKETAKAGVATTSDKVAIKMDMFIDAVPVEGGQAPNHQVYLNEPHYIPGLAEQLVGLKKDDAKEFSLKFPKEHYQKHLAGRDVDFKIQVNDVFDLSYPAIDDAFAKALGQESLEKLSGLLKANLMVEATKKEDQRQEAAILEQLIEKSEFSELPEVLIDSEKRKMFYELKHDLERQGIQLEDYLKNLKKTEKEIFTDFAEQAEKRAKAALISRRVALDNTILVTPEELNKEKEAIRAAYPDNPQVEENLARPEVLDTLATTIQNRKVLQWLKEQIVSK